jgi:predicted flap endonuclease-1-like 5' DNA nuclease
MAEAETTPVADLSRTLTLPIGAFSPLWLAFAGAAASGAAFFWMSRWMKPVNLEAAFAAGAPSTAETGSAPAAALAVVEPAVALAEAALEAVEPAIHRVEKTLETAVEAAAEETAVLMEAAAPVVETAMQTALAAASERAAGFVEAMTPAEPVVDDQRTVIAEAPADPAPAFADDLTRLVGIGPKLSAALAERGVSTFADIAAWTTDDLAEVDQALSLKGRAVRDAWVAQAKRLIAAS